MARFGSIDEVVAFLDATPHRVIGIAGPPGAGKSTIAAELVARVASAALLPMDGYHYPQSRLVELGRRDRMGAPDTFDVPAFVATLASFRNDGLPVVAPGFNREIEEPVLDAITISPSFRKVIVEGNYLLLDSGGWQAVAPLLDVTFYIEVDDDLRRSRLIARHVQFGKSEVDARAWALGSDESNARIIADAARHADHVIALHELK